MKNRPQAVILHYSPFAYGAHGLPLIAPFLPLVARILRLRVTTILHEVYFPWGRSGLRGLIWALFQRAALVPVLLGSSSLIVTSEEQRERLSNPFVRSGRRAFKIPVWSTIPVQLQDAGDLGNRPEAQKVLGTFGWARRDAAIDVVLDAVRSLVSERFDIKLLFIGAPGPHSHEAQQWKEAAASRGIGSRVVFTGEKSEPEQISVDLSSLDVYLHVDPAGVSTGRTSLAAAFAHGRPIVAFVGDKRPAGLREPEELLLVPLDPEALTASLKQVLTSNSLNRRLSEGAQRAYRREMAVARGVSLLSAIATGATFQNPPAGGRI
ncbi:MAG: glycosyltransferase [Actinomycetota bacterium]